MQPSRGLAGKRPGRKEEPANSGGKQRSQAGAESSRCPAAMPGRIWESSDGPGRCVRAFSGQQTEKGTTPPPKKERALLIFAFPDLNSHLPPGTHTFIVRATGDTKPATKIVEVWIKYSAVRLPPFRCQRGAIVRVDRSYRLLLRPNGSCRYGTDTRCSPSKMSLMVCHSE